MKQLTYFWVSPECPDVDFARTHGPDRVDNDCNEGLLVALVQELRAHIDTR